MAALAAMVLPSSRRSNGLRAARNAGLTYAMSLLRPSSGPRMVTSGLRRTSAFERRAMMSMCWVVSPEVCWGLGLVGLRV